MVFFLEKYVDKLIAVDARVTVSMSGVDKVHDNIKNCPNSFQRIAGFFDFLSRHAPAYFSNVGVNCVMTPDNIDGIEELIHFYPHILFILFPFNTCNFLLLLCVI